MSDADALLQKVLDADRSLRQAREGFLASGAKRAMLDAIDREITRSFSADDAIEGAARLSRAADLLMEIGDGDSARSLFKILGHDDPSVRVAAGEALVELLYDRFAEVARALEAEMTRGASVTALAELPFVLAEVAEPGGIKIVQKLLAHADADVVGAAVEALAQMGDVSVVKSLEPLVDDARKVTIDEGEEEGAEVTVGDLAGEAIEHLRRMR